MHAFLTVAVHLLIEFSIKNSVVRLHIHYAVMILSIIRTVEYNDIAGGMIGTQLHYN